MKKKWRLKLMVMRKVQIKYLSLIMISMVIPTILSSVVIYFLIWHMVADEMGLPENLAVYLMPALQRVNAVLFIGFPVLLIVMLFWGLRFSNRLVGPIFRLIRELGEIEQGEDKKIVFREKDEFHDLAEAINRAMVSVKQRSRQQGPPEAFE